MLHLLAIVLGKRRTILEIDEYWDNEVIADGMTIDEDGFIWIALMFHGCVSNQEDLNFRKRTC